MTEVEQAKKLKELYDAYEKAEEAVRDQCMQFLYKYGSTVTNGSTTDGLYNEANRLLKEAYWIKSLK